MSTVTTTVTSAESCGKTTTVTTTEASASAGGGEGPKAASTVGSTVEQPQPTIDLYFIANTRGTRIAWLLEELAYSYTHVVPSLGSWLGAVDFCNRDLAQAVYSRMGHDFSRLLHTGLEHAGVPTKIANKVPVVSFSNGVGAQAGWMFESAAIIQIILENEAMSKGELSGLPEERPQFLQWLNFAETILEHSSSKIISGGIFDNGPDSKELAMKLARDVMESQLDMIERELNDHGGAYLLKSGFSAVDVACGFSVINSWKRGLLNADDDTKFPKAHVWMQSLLARDGCKRAFARTKCLVPGRYTCEPGNEPVLTPNSGVNFEDPTPEWMAGLVAKYPSATA